MSPHLLESIKYWERSGYLNINFKLEILAKFEFLGVKFVNKLFIKLLNFIRIFVNVCVYLQCNS